MVEEEGGPQTDTNVIPEKPQPQKLDIFQEIRPLGFFEVHTVVSICWAISLSIMLHYHITHFVVTPVLSKYEKDDLPEDQITMLEVRAWFHTLGMVSIFFQMAAACNQKQYRASFYFALWHFLASLGFTVFIFKESTYGEGADGKQLDWYDVGLSRYDSYGIQLPNSFQYFFTTYPIIFMLATINLIFFARRPSAYFIRR